MLDTGGVVVGHNARFLGLLGSGTGTVDAETGFSFLDPGDREMARSLLGGMTGDGSLTLRASLLGTGGQRVKVLGFWSLMAPVGPLRARYIGLFVEVPDAEPQELPVAGSQGDPPAAVSHAGDPSPPPIDEARREQIIHTIVFHDAKNRLAALHGYAALLRESLQGSEFLSYLDKLDEIASEVERDLGVASMFSHLGLIAPRWQNLRDIVGRSASREAEGRVSLDGLPGSLWCLADPLFPRVFSNLFENARRHGERVTSIRITAREEDSGLLVTVEDDGIGVPADVKERIFELGFGRHTGYGLYLAREILSIAGFSIRETGDPGKGARFDIRIPRGRYMVHPSAPKEPDKVRIPAA
ncbi:MAG: HAMP domain-containing histidine kinase [Methanomicrobiales archaeon]|nr:HAMP domain-containing histidine kinase [Methanomicrobiales archaeon]